MSKMKNLDFAIIGAGKSGTTSLFKYLAVHQEIFMPGVKELSFFALPSLFSKGIDWYYEEHFSKADASLLWGEASPAYMTYAETPVRLWETIPEVKLVAILRNPVDRAFSHHQHLYRAGRETRDFDSCIYRLAERGTVSDDRIETSNGWHSEYVMDGEYGRLLENFLRYFPRDQLRIYFFEDLLSEPVSLMEDLYQWLGVDSKNPPSVVGKIYNPGGELRFPLFTKTLRSVIKGGTQVDWLNAMLRKLGLRSTLAKYWFKFNTEIAVRHKVSEGPSDEERDFLVNHYRQDVKKLEEILGASTPWQEFQSGSKESLRDDEPSDAKNKEAA